MQRNKNIVINVLIKEVGGKQLIDFVAGHLDFPGEPNCKISYCGQSVYGFAIVIASRRDKEDLYNKIVAELGGSIVKSWKEWKPIGVSKGLKYYPLYWGKSKANGGRLLSHVHCWIGQGSKHLQDIKALVGREIIYGSVLCRDYSTFENKLHRDFPDILAKRR